MKKIKQALALALMIIWAFPTAAWSSTPPEELAEQEYAFAWVQNNSPEKTLTVAVTAYCACPICCGKTDGITCSGNLVQENHTIAVDPNIIPLGTEVYLEGLGTFVAEDTGGAIKGNRIDIYMKDHTEALMFGIKETKAYMFKGKI